MLVYYTRVSAMKFSLGYWAIFDGCVFAAIIAGLSYLIVISYGDYNAMLYNEEESEREEFAFDAAEELNEDSGHLTRHCHASGSTIFQAAVDIEYSRNVPLTQPLTPAEVQDIGDSILGNLFDVSLAIT